MKSIETINYTRILLFIDLMNIVFDVLYDITYLIFTSSIIFFFKRENSHDKIKRGQRRFRGLLIHVLFNTPYLKVENLVKKTYKSKTTPLSNQNVQKHCWQAFTKRGYCTWCRREKARPVVAEIVNQAACQRGSRVYGGCTACGVYLCVKGDCFKQFHSQ